MTRKEEIENGLKYFEQNKQRLASLYKEMYGEAICLTCPGSVEYAYHKMYNDRDKEPCYYKMKRGSVINTMMRNEEDIPKGYFTFHNMTDEIARKLIEFGYGDKFL